jgi:hypothetical protein
VSSPVIVAHLYYSDAWCFKGRNIEEALPINLARLRILFALLSPVIAGCVAIEVVCTFWSLYDNIVASAQKSSGAT